MPLALLPLFFAILPAVGLTASVIGHALPAGPISRTLLTISALLPGDLITAWQRATTGAAAK